MAKLASAQNSVHLARSPAQVLDYLEATLAPRLSQMASFTIDREANTAGGMIFPGSRIEGSAESTTVIHIPSGRLTGWILVMTCTAVADGTNVDIDVTQINDSFLQRKLIGAKLQGYAAEIAAVLHADLGD